MQAQLNKTVSWCALGASEVSVDIPSALPDGEYLIRAEHIALHDAGYVGGAQFYLACGQINITGGGSGSPGPLVSFPGAYSSSDPGILIDFNGPPPKEYIFPGPEVWEG